MKILDRYILVSFVKNYLISFMVLVGLYIALDMVFKFGDITEAPNSAGGALPVWKILYDIGDYYFYQSFLFFVHLSGMITVVAAAFTLMRLSRFNELTGILAAGTPLLRVALPIVMAGVVLNVLLIADQELVVPRMIPKLIRSHEDMHSETKRSFPVWGVQDNRNGLLWASDYTPPTSTAPAHIDVFDVIEEDEQGRPHGHLYADAADWDASALAWKLVNGNHIRILQPNEINAEKPVPTDVYRSDITPEEVALWHGGDFVELLPLYRINELLDPKERKSYGLNGLLRTKNMRFTQPLVNVILLLLAIPTVLTREPGKLKSASMRCLVVTGLCMGSVFLTYQLASKPPTLRSAQLWPEIMAWTPIFLFGPLSVWLLDRVKT